MVARSRYGRQRGRSTFSVGAATCDSAPGGVIAVHRHRVGHGRCYLCEGNTVEGYMFHIRAVPVAECHIDILSGVSAQVKGKMVRIVIGKGILI